MIKREKWFIGVLLSAVILWIAYPAISAVVASAVKIVGKAGVEADVNSSNELKVAIGAISAQVDSIAPMQGTTLLNVLQQSSTNASNTVTLSATAAQRNVLRSITAFCSAGTASVAVSDGGTNIWGEATGSITTTTRRIDWPVGLTGATNSAVVIVVGTCGVGNTSTLSVQADRSAG